MDDAGDGDGDGGRPDRLCERGERSILAPFFLLDLRSTQ